MDQQESMREPLQKVLQAQSQDRQILSDNQADVTLCNWSQHSEVEVNSMPPEIFPHTNENSPDNSCPQGQKDFVQQQKSVQNTPWKQDVDLLPGLGSSNDREVEVYRNRQFIQKDHISTWIGVFLLLVVLLVAILLMHDAGVAFVRVLFVVSLLPFILVFGLIVGFLVIALFRLLAARIRERSVTRINRVFRN